MQDVGYHASARLRPEMLVSEDEMKSNKMKRIYIQIKIALRLRKEERKVYNTPGSQLG